MASLDSLPDELLCEVIEFVHGSSESSDNLFHILLVAPKFYRVTKDVLYKSPRLLKPSPTDPVHWDDRRAHQIRGLLRAIIENPDLAKRIHRLNLTVISERRPGRSWTEPQVIEQIDSSTRHYHWPDSDDRKEVIDDLNLSRECVRNLMYMKNGWEFQVRTGYEPAMAGLILALTPSLNHLSINNFQKMKRSGSFDEASAQTNPNRPAFKPQSMNPIDWFGRRVMFDACTIAGLANLVSIKSNGFIPWPIISQTKLRFLEIACPRANISMPLRIPSTTAASISNIRSLTIRAGCEIIQESDQWGFWGARGFSIASYIAKLTKKFLGLRTLDLVISGAPAAWLDGGYDYVLDRIIAPALHTLILNTQGVTYSTDTQETAGLIASQIKPMTSLMQFPDLRRIVALPGAFAVEKATMPCALPHTVETIEVIDPTETFMEHLISMLTKIDCLPNLAAVLMWRDDSLSGDHGEPALALPESTVEWISSNGIFVGLATAPRKTPPDYCGMKVLREIKVRTKTSAKAI